MENIKENNRLIAEFMGHEISIPKYSGGEEDWSIIQNGKKVIQTDVRYHISWDWLMPVVEKIEDLGHGVTIYRKGCLIINMATFNINGFSHSSKIEQTYKVVVEFIKFYNDETKQER